MEISDKKLSLVSTENGRWRERCGYPGNMGWRYNRATIHSFKQAHGEMLGTRGQWQLATQEIHIKNDFSGQSGEGVCLAGSLSCSDPQYLIGFPKSARNEF